ncbi:MAG: polysaccharide biosynthesis/export family protein [Terracidiphilus sp.]|jgi:polysaccharide export outer membrane protein
MKFRGIDTGLFNRHPAATLLVAVGGRNSDARRVLKELPVNLLSKGRTLVLCGLVSLMFCERPAVAAQANDQPLAKDASSNVQTATDPNPANPPDPKLKLSPLETLRRFEPSADEEYTLGAGDEISIQFPGRPDLASKDVIGPDGRVTLPLAGPIKLADLTRQAAGEKVVEALSPYYTKLTATVEVEKYGSNHVTLLGDVRSPGMVSFEQTPTLLEVLSRGGIQARPDGRMPEQCVIYRGDQVYWVELQELLTSGSPLADLRLRRNDVIFVPALSTRTVTIMGQVQHPGLIALKHDSTLASVLGEAGGVSDGAGGNPEIQIVHRSKGDKTQYVHFRDLLKPTGGLEVSLNPGDIVYVPKSGFAKMGFVMQQLAPFVTMASFAAIVH